MNARDDAMRPVVVITGGTRGIGRAIALHFAGEHAGTIVLIYLENHAAAAETARMVESMGARCILVPANLMFPDEIDRALDLHTAGVRDVDIFVHCAAMTAFKPLLDVRANQWDLTMNVSTRSFLLCVQRVVPLMPPEGGSIVALSSLGSGRVLPNYGAMGCAKAALEASVRYLAAELAPRKIRVNAVSGGFVATDALEKMPDGHELLEESLRQTPMGRCGTAEDIARVVGLLCSPGADWICGQVISADGGISIR